jgi:hypothetical protein
VVLVVSDEIHRSVVRQGYAGIDPGAYTRVPARPVSGLPRSGWARPVEAPKALPQRTDGEITNIDDHRRGA